MNVTGNGVTGPDFLYLFYIYTISNITNIFLRNKRGFSGPVTPFPVRFMF